MLQAMSKAIRPRRIEPPLVLPAKKYCPCPLLVFPKSSSYKVLSLLGGSWMVSANPLVLPATKARKTIPLITFDPVVIFSSYQENAGTGGGVGRDPRFHLGSAALIGATQTRPFFFYVRFMNPRSDG